MEKPSGPVGRVALRAYLGTIPDYTPGNVVGVKLAGVAKGGPADQAGMQGGDIVVEVAGKKVENIYDYTYAVDALQIGVPVPLVVQRGEQRVALTVTPSSRE
jgi:S1-C subfamily serine protease